MCDEKIQELISGHLDGCNTPEQEAFLHEHLATCPACNQKMKDYKKMQETIESLEKEAPASLSSNVMDAVAKDDLPKPKPFKKLPFRYGTAIAAVAAALVLVIGSGKFGLPSSGTAAIHPQNPETEAVEEESTEHRTLEDAAITAPEVTAADALPANVDCQALAQAQGCIVGVLYGEAPEELAEAEYLALSGGRQYAIPQEQLLELSQSFPEMQLYYPDFEPTDAQATAYLIIVQ